VNRGTSALHRDAETAAAALRVKLVPIEASEPEHLEPAVEALTRERVDLVLVIGGPLFFSERKRIVALMAAARLPVLYAWRETVEAGGLMSYGINLRESFRRSAFFVDKILKGTKPGDLPVELPTKFELVINLNTAKALGLTITREFQLLADEVIE
jgi:putative tryptophan/tyrosine transport system substrate-binding protein